MEHCPFYQSSYCTAIVDSLTDSLPELVTQGFHVDLCGALIVPIGFSVLCGSSLVQATILVATSTFTLYIISEVCPDMI